MLRRHSPSTRFRFRTIVGGTAPFSNARAPVAWQAPTARFTQEEVS